MDRDPILEFDGVVLGLTSERDRDPEIAPSAPALDGGEGCLYDVAIEQLGTFRPHRMFVPPSMEVRRGMSVRCNMVEIGKKNSFDDFLFVPLGFDATLAPQVFRK